MTTPPSPFETLATLTAGTDPTDQAKLLGAALAAVPDLQRWLREARQTAVLAMRADGMSHADVAKALGTSRSRAQQIAEGRTTGKRATTD
jgi:DNA-directed RNA polymerase specialized sigma24 family protein